MEPAFKTTVLKNWELKLPPTIHFGPGCAARAGAEAAKCGRRALVVTDKSLVKAGHVDRLLTYLADAGVQAVVYDGVDTEPTDVYVDEGLTVLRESACEVVVCLGGGSPIDAGKAIAAMATNPAPITAYMGANKLANDPLPIIALPTTAGTGSEITRNTIITDTKNDVKMLIASERIVPRVAIVDPQLSVTMPLWVSASTGIDALTHAIEAYISKRAQILTDELALEAIGLIGKFLRRSWANPEDAEARASTVLAASVAGMAFSNSSVALVHGMARPIGVLFHVPHGVSNAILLPTVMEYTALGCPERFACVAAAMGERVKGLSPMAGARKAVEAVRQLCEDVRIPRVADLGIDPAKYVAALPKMAADALASGSPNNNPRVPTKEEIVDLYRALLG